MRRFTGFTTILVRRERGQGVAAYSTIRTIIFVLAGAFILGGPFVQQALGIPLPGIRTWKMFGVKALDYCMVEYKATAPDGDTWVVRRDKAQGFADNPPRARNRHLRSATAAQADGRRLCRTLPEGTALHFTMKCAHKTRGWKEIVSKSRDLCAKGSDREPVILPQPPERPDAPTEIDD